MSALPAQPSVSAALRPRPGSAVALAASVSALLELGYLLWRPQAPDLAAQLARASAVSRGVGWWWAGWYGGINTAPYSVAGAQLMSALGVGVVGIAATAVVAIGGADLLRGCARPRAGAVAIAAVACANLYAGRITFATGMALAVLSFCLVERKHVRAALLAATLTGLLSPLAALCSALGWAALAVGSHHHRTRYLLGAGASAAPVLLIAALFGQASVMPFSNRSCAAVVLLCTVVALAPVPRTIRLLAVGSAAVAVLAFLVPSPVGYNAARMPMLLAGPLLLATARLTTVRSFALAAALLAWPAANLVQELAVAAQPSSAAAFYQPLLAQLPAAGTSTQRLEVLDTQTHGASYYLSEQVPLARGWERQTDAAENPVFYDGSLSPLSYRDWLSSRAVGLVAVPHVPLDRAAVSEAKLIAGGLPYLQEQWSDPHWTLFRVVDPQPAASGVLSASALTDTGVTLQASGPGRGPVHLRYSRLLTVRSLVDPTLTGCVAKSPDGESIVTVPRAGAYLLRAELGTLLNSCS